MSRAGRTLAFVGVCFLALTACELIAGIEEKELAAANNDTGASPPDTGDHDAGDGADVSKPECGTHRECIDAHGENWICVKPEGKCQSLVNDDCDLVLAGARGATPQQKAEVLSDDNT